MLLKLITIAHTVLIDDGLAAFLGINAVGNDSLLKSKRNGSQSQSSQGHDMSHFFSKSALIASDDTKEQFGTTVCLIDLLEMSMIIFGFCGN